GLVSLYRPHDHVCHKGISLSLPNVGDQNLWGGPTYRRGLGYRQYDNDGSMRHRDFTDVTTSGARVGAAHDLDWIAQDGRELFTEHRRFAVETGADAWTLLFGTAFTNAGPGPVVLGSPTTEGRENAGYGGLFWRGPRSFTDGAVRVPGRTGGDGLMGVHAPWLAYTGRHDEEDASSTVVFVDGSGTPPVRWFVRANPFAAVCPAPFFDTEVTVAPGETLSLRYAVVGADGDPGDDGAPALAAKGASALTGW
ncbi:MAG TPA: PmoA family protein, partial [Phytomonospora sp.]